MTRGMTKQLNGQTVIVNRIELDMPRITNIDALRVFYFEIDRMIQEAATAKELSGDELTALYIKNDFATNAIKKELGG